MIRRETARTPKFVDEVDTDEDGLVQQIFSDRHDQRRVEMREQTALDYLEKERTNREDDDRISEQQLVAQEIAGYPLEQFGEITLSQSEDDLGMLWAYGADQKVVWFCVAAGRERRH